MSPWPSRQRQAIAAQMVRDGKTPEEISRFFREHGHDDEKPSKDDKRKKRGER